MTGGKEWFTVRVTCDRPAWSREAWAAAKRATPPTCSLVRDDDSGRMEFTVPVGLRSAWGSASEWDAVDHARRVVDQVFMEASMDADRPSRLRVTVQAERSG